MDSRIKKYLPSLAAAACVVATLGPVATVIGFGAISIAYVDTGDGKLVVGLVVGFAGLAALLRSRGSIRISASFDALGASLVGAVAGYDYYRLVRHVAGDDVAGTTVGWGLYAVLLAAGVWFALAFASFLTPQYDEAVA